MKILLLLSFMLGFTHGAIVLDLPDVQENKTFLSLSKTIEATNPITICVRLKFKRQIRNRVIFSGNDNNLRLTLRSDQEYGWFVQSEVRFIFAIPKNHLQPYKWHHLCVNSDKESYRSGFLKRDQNHSPNSHQNI